MTKFFALLTSLVISTSATVGAQQLAPRVDSSPHRQSAAALVQNPAKTAQQTDATKYLYGQARGAKRSPMVRVEVTPKHAMKAQSATDDFIEVVATEYAYEWEYIPNSKDWYCSVENDDYLMKIDVLSDNSETPVGEYTTKDFDFQYAYGQDLNIEDQQQSLIQYATAEATVTTTGYKTYDLDATITTRDGRTFHVVCTPDPPLEPTETTEFAANITSLDLNKDGSTLVFTGANKTFTLEYEGAFGFFRDFVGRSGVADETGKVQDIDNGSLRVTLDEDNNICIEGELVTADAKGYKFTATRPFEVEGRKSITAHNLMVSDLWGLLFYLRGTDDDGNMVTATMYSPIEEGDFTDDMTIYVNTADEQEIESFCVKRAVVTLDSNGEFVFDASVIGNDYIDYTIHLDCYVPDVKATRDFYSTKGRLTDITDRGGVVQVYGDSEDGNDWFSVILEMDKLASGHFEKLTSAYRSTCQILTDQKDPDAIAVHSMNAINLDFTYNEADETYKLTGTCQTDTILWNINFSGKVTGVTGSDYDMQNDVNYTFSSDDIIAFEHRGSGTDSFFLLTATDGISGFSTQLFTESDELPAGDYTFNSSREPGSALSCQIDAAQGTIAPTFFGTLNSEGYINVPLFMCMNGKVSVSYDNQGKVSVLVDATNTWDFRALIGINHVVDGVRAATVSDNAKNGKFCENGQFFIRRDGVKYNALGQKIK